jgi:hypothetical protein
VSKERAVRRAERQAQVAAEAAARSRRAARSARFSALTSKLPGLRGLFGSSGRATGPLAAKRRRTVGLIVLGFLVLQALTWAATPDWGVRVAVLLASVFALPVVALFAL